jgi:hypothetical protein
MSLTSTERDLVEHMAQEQFRYESIFEEQRKILQKDQAKYEQAIAKTLQSSFVAKPGQHWQPTQDKVDEYIAKCDEICHSIPRDFEEFSVMQLSKGARLTFDKCSRVKIMFAAHAALICMVTGKVAQQRECVQLAILRRHNEIL